MHQFRKRYSPLTYFVVLVFLFLLTPSWVHASPANIVLRYFRGFGQTNGVQLEWSTATEFGTAGFEVHRSTNGASGTFTKLTGIGSDGFVLATGSDITGANYQELDNTVVTGQTYWYLLVEIENTGEEVRYEDDIFSIVAGAPTPTSTPPPLATTTPNAGNATTIPTSTNEPTNTPINTPPPNATLTRTPTPTNTPLPTNQPTNTPRPVGPTPTSFSFPPTNTPTNVATTQAIAQSNTATPAQPLTTETPNDSGYPAPTATNLPPTPIITTPDTAAYVQPTSFVPSALLTSTPINNDSGTSSDDLPPLQATQQATDGGTTSGSNTVILWVGFIVALILLVAGITIALQYYKRQ